MKSSTNHLVPLLKSHQLLEQNEDTIASIVENLQLGRLDNCLVQYSNLLSNLISLSLEFDNYPAEDEHEDFSDIVCKFPDALMRKDLLDDLRSPDHMFTPEPPMTPPCTECAALKKTAVQCRVEAGHVGPHNKFTSAELRDFLSVTEVLAQQHGEYNVEKLKNKNKSKKMYKRWNAMEKYTVMLAIARTGSKEVSKLLSSVENRTENQLRSFINKNFTPSQLEDLQRGIIPPPPPQYQPPAALDNAFTAHFDETQTQGGSRAVSKLSSAEASTLAPVENGGDGSWNSLLRQAAAKWTGDTMAIPAAKLDNSSTTGTTATTAAKGTAPQGQVPNDPSQIAMNQNFDPNLGSSMDSNFYMQQQQMQSHQQYAPDGLFNAYQQQINPYDPASYGNIPFFSSTQPLSSSFMPQSHDPQNQLYFSNQLNQPLQPATATDGLQTQAAAPSSSTKRGRGGSKSAATGSGTKATARAARERAEAEAALAAQKEMIMRAVATGTISGDSYERFLQAISTDPASSSDDAAFSADSFPSHAQQLFLGSPSSSSGDPASLNLFGSVTGFPGQSQEQQPWSNTSGGGIAMLGGADAHAQGYAGDFLDDEARMYYCAHPEEENSLLMFGT